MVFTTSYDLERPVAWKMSPWVVLVSLAAACVAQNENCSGVTPGGDCETKQGTFQVVLETEYLCREATRVVLHWKSKNASVPIHGVDELNNYIVTAYLADEKPLKKVQWGETDQGLPYKNFYGLTPNRTYTFGIVVSTNWSETPIEVYTKETYTTLAKNVEKLPEVTHSSITNPVLLEDGLATNFSWTPVPENVCSYEIVVINRNGSDGNHPTHIISRPYELRSAELRGLKFGTVISIGVFATIENESEGGAGHVEGKPFWTTFKMPECHQFYGWNFNICKPFSPQNVTASVKECNLDLKWAPSENPPPWYQILVYPLDPRKNETIKTAIEGIFHHFEGPTHNMGDYLEVRIAAHSHAGSSTPVNLRVENECTPSEASRPYGPRPHYTEEKSSSTVLLILLVALLFVLIVLVGSFGLYKVYMARKAVAPQPLRNQESCEMTQPLARNVSRLGTSKAFYKCESKDTESSGDASSADDAGEFELRRQSLHLKEVVGEGEFGVVRRAYLVLGNDKREVAVKMLRDDASGEDKKQLKLELEVMKSVGTHNNIVCLVGFCSPNHMLVVEYCSLGDLQNYLRDIWRSKNWTKNAYIKNNPGKNFKHENVVSNLLYNKTEVEKKQLNVTIFDLISLARQVALGMEYLSSNKVVHRDLAARNILLNENFTAKISDFGLSRDVYEENLYRHKGVRRLPVKWMAIECLVHQMFTSKSDVWSFGILLWEIMTLGGCPYPTLQSAEVQRSLLRGERLERPKLCPPNLYALMQECWNPLPHLRPTFSQLVHHLEAMLQSDAQHRYLELDEVIGSYSHLY
ncbi:hypothetical protein GE061_005301 [Apolygus lucorum]|uniref:receptor protein-tyrosine kinase n=1 Tax=Apolygus lucorum TaxID=248454 RepID=A0A8S9WX87_APOLU|nr:hypothetical protein GE061_005301 [Apolygus lucorum]